MYVIGGYAAVSYQGLSLDRYQGMPAVGYQGLSLDRYQARPAGLICMWALRQFSFVVVPIFLQF